jgi:hypothetical protein
MASSSLYDVSLTKLPLLENPALTYSPLFSLYIYFPSKFENTHVLDLTDERTNSPKVIQNLKNDFPDASEVDGFEELTLVPFHPS